MADSVFGGYGTCGYPKGTRYAINLKRGSSVTFKDGSILFTDGPPEIIVLAPETWPREILEGG
jgi:hypothetical protein